MPTEVLLIAIVVGIILLILDRRYRAMRREEQQGWGALLHYAAAHAAQSPQPAPAPAQLSKKTRVDQAITANQITLLATSQAAKDEFFGQVEILEGHHTCTPATRRALRHIARFKSWEFLGGADRYDFHKRTAEFAELTQVFKAEVQTILAELRAQGWTAQPVSEDHQGEVYHLTR